VIGPDGIGESSGLDQEAEDLAAAKLVERFKAGDVEAFGTLYKWYFDRVFVYMKTLLSDVDEAEDVTQDTFTQVLERLHEYEARGKPFRAWLFVVARNHALNRLRKLSRFEVEDPETIARRRDRPIDEEPRSLTWITDSNLMLFFERLPLPQRQVLLLRFLLELRPGEVAAILDRTPEDVRGLQHRALRFLRERLTALSRDYSGRSNDSAKMKARFKQAPVLRHRRFMLDP